MSQGKETLIHLLNEAWFLCKFAFAFLVSHILLQRDESLLPSGPHNPVNNLILMMHRVLRSHVLHS